MKTIKSIINEINDNERNNHFDVCDYPNEVEILLSENADLIKLSILHIEGGSKERLYNHIDEEFGLIDTRSLISMYADDDSNCRAYIFGTLEQCEKWINEALQDVDDEETLKYLSKWEEELDIMQADEEEKVLEDEILVLDLYEGWRRFNVYDSYIELGHDDYILQAVLTEEAKEYID